jgi:hypothetical protein
MAFKQATVNASLVAATLSNYPSYVDFSRVGITTLAEAQSSRIYADSGKVVEWAREVVSAAEGHTKVPSMTTTTSTFIDYDGIRADYAVTDTYGRNAVWSGYVNVWHLEGNRVSATGGATLSEPDGAVSYSSQKIGEGAVMNNRRLRDASNMSLNWSNDYFWSWWAKPAAFTGYSHDIVTTSGASRRMLAVWDTGSSNSLVIYCGGFGGTNTFTVGSQTADVYVNWHLVKTGTTWELFRNGVSQGTKTSGTATYTNNLFAIGGSVDAGANGNASYDEFRLSTSTRSADWITTEYNNQNNESSFWGTWTDAGGAIPRGGILLAW